jgi:hypothetical protein
VNYFERFPASPRAREFVDGFIGDNADNRYVVVEANTGFDLVTFDPGVVTILSPDPSGAGAGITRPELFPVGNGSFFRWMAEIRHNTAAEYDTDLAIGLNISISHFSAPFPDAIYFTIPAQNTRWRCVIRNGGNEVYNAEVGSVFPLDTIQTLAIRGDIDATGKFRCIFYIDKVAVASAELPFLPCDLGPGVLAIGQLTGNLQLLSWGTRARII